ncbi:MAG: hypothetical protein RL701_3805 [Pseudomonadota bacterium]|jgi:hypothetical protein
MALKHRVGWDPRLCERSRWLWPLTAAAEYFAGHEDWPKLADFDAAYRAHTQGRDVAPLSFRENVRKQDKRAEGRVVLSALYDARISIAHEVPTRERDWHDLLNMLCFATFPDSKLALHSRQYACLAQRIAPDMQRLPNRRTPEQDALTLFDEGGVVLVAHPDDAPRLEHLSLEQGAEVCRALRDERRLRVVPFGHALFEHELEGLRCPGGATIVLTVPELWAETPQLLREVDRALSARIGDSTYFQSPRSCGQIRLSAFDL